MKVEVIIPDPVFHEAERAAERTGVSLDRYLSDALVLHFEDTFDGPQMTQELLTSLHRAEEDVDAGLGLTMAQVEKDLASKRAAWLLANPR
jgi:hypothetical protein